MKRLKILLMIALAGVGILSASPATAHLTTGTAPPCDIEVVDALNSGDNGAVISTLYSTHGHEINAWAVNLESVSEPQREIVQLVALAVLRTEGTIARAAVDQRLHGKWQQANVQWAIRAMEGLAFVGAVPRRHLMEAWGRDESLQSAALHELAKLESEGRLESEHQKKLLRRLRAQRLRETGDVTSI